jgi:chemotaxis protein CheD
MASPSIASLFVQRVVVGVGDLSASNNAMLTLSTYALGSCVAVVAYDPTSKASGLLHLMLPESSISPAKAVSQPAMFADTGLPMLFRALEGLKANRSRLRLFVTGGASVLCDSGVFKIGERNVKTTLGWLAQHGYSVRASAVGGVVNRTVHLEINTGNLELKTPSGIERATLGG